MKLKLFIAFLIVVCLRVSNCYPFEEEFPYEFSRANGQIIGPRTLTEKISIEELEKLNKYRKLASVKTNDQIFMRAIIPWDVALSDEEGSGWIFKKLFSNSQLMRFYRREVLEDGTIRSDPTWSYGYLVQNAKRWINRWHQSKTLEESLSIMTIFENKGSTIQPIGIIGLFVNEHQECQASALIDSIYQGRGIMKACFFRLMNIIATHQLELNCKVRVSVRPENLASRSLIENLGFIKDEESREDDDTRNLLYYKSPISVKEYALFLAHRPRL